MGDERYRIEIRIGIKIDPWQHIYIDQVSRIATDLLAPHLAGGRQPIDWQAEAVGQAAVTPPTKRKYSATLVASFVPLDKV
ncbi:MAG: hypothetical protein PHO37_13525 [Kiritimatiellae bacterium]|nr:hypothetical protein [Kiritimatiellia bacterium]